MIPKQYRLTKKRDFEIAFGNGRFVGGALTSMKVWHISPEKYPKRKYTRDMLKIGFVVGKKVHKSAVKRNRAKRQMREVVRLLLKNNNIRVGRMIIFMAKPSILEASYLDIEQDMTAILKKAKLMRL